MKTAFSAVRSWPVEPKIGGHLGGGGGGGQNNLVMSLVVLLSCHTENLVRVIYERRDQFSKPPKNHLLGAVKQYTLALQIRRRTVDPVAFQSI